MRLATACACHLILLFSLSLLSGPALSQDVRVTDQVYVRHDGGTDPAITSCSSDATTPSPGGDEGGNRQQNEPAVAINPSNTDVIVAGANDACPVVAFGDIWMGFYVSTDGGASWINSLLPGYPLDTSLEGRASPIFGRAQGESDPILDWDNDNRLFFGAISFNRTVPNRSGLVVPDNGDVIVSTWRYDPSTPLGMDYLRTTIVGKGTPTPFPAGRGNDKPSLRVDDWQSSPYEGNVYISWTLFPGVAGRGQIRFSRSTDHGVRFSRPLKISKDVTAAQGSDIAVAPDGTVYVVWRQFATLPPRVGDAIVFVKSTDGGLTFSNPRIVRAIVPYDREDRSVTGGFAEDCGDGPFLCASGFVFHRTAALPQATVDAFGDVYVSWEELIPAADNGDSYRPDGQARAVVSKSTNGGGTWSAPVAIDPQGAGHQWWPNLEFDKTTRTLVAIYYDSRSDPFYSVNRPPANKADGKSSCGVPAPATCDVLNTYIAVSADGVTWSPTKVSAFGHEPEYEMFEFRDVPFHGDYNWVDANGGSVYGTWADNRDVVPGTDIREPNQDGFDVLQCQPGALSLTNNCDNAGGLNQNIYGFGGSLP